MVFQSLVPWYPFHSEESLSWHRLQRDPQQGHALLPCLAMAALGSGVECWGLTASL